jgi:hypothetical protein
MKDLKQAKQQADALLTNVCGGYILKIKNDNIYSEKIRIKERYDNGSIEVTKSVYDKLNKKYNIECDF